MLSPARIGYQSDRLRGLRYDVNDVQDLERAAEASDHFVREAALAWLAHRFPQEALGTLKKALDAPEPSVRCTAARLLAILGDSSGLVTMRRDLLDLAIPANSTNEEIAKHIEEKTGGMFRRQSSSSIAYYVPDAAVVLAEFGDTSGYALAAQAVIGHGHTISGTRAAVRVLTELSRLDKATLQEQHCDPEAVLLEMVEANMGRSAMSDVRKAVQERMPRESAARIVARIDHSADLLKKRREQNGQSDSGPSKPSEEDLETLRFAADSEYNKKVRSEIADNGTVFLDASGIRTSLGSKYTARSPLVEVIPKIRELGGQIRPFQAEALHIYGLNTVGLGSHSVRGEGLRIQIASSQDRRSSVLLYGKEYSIAAAYIADEGQRRINAHDSALVVKMPAHLNDGEIYRIELVLLDKVAQRRKEEAKKRAEAEKKRIAEEETIRIYANYPRDVDSSYWIACYRHGEHSRQASDPNGCGQMTLRGPHPLGGDLVIYYPRSDPGGPWCYVHNLQTRTVHLPENADFVFAREDMVRVYFDVGNQDLAATGFTMIALYPSRDGSLPISMIPVWPPTFLEGTRLKLRLPWAVLPPGTFYLRARRRVGRERGRWEETPFGTIEITGEAKKVYELKLPDRYNPLGGTYQSSVSQSLIF